MFCWIWWYIWITLVEWITYHSKNIIIYTIMRDSSPSLPSQHVMIIFPETRRRRTYVGLMLAHCLRWWPNHKQTYIHIVVWCWLVWYLISKPSITLSFYETSFTATILLFITICVRDDIWWQYKKRLSNWQVRDTWVLPSKRVTFLSHCWFNVGSPSTTLAQHWTSNGSMSRVCWLVS